VVVAVVDMADTVVVVEAVEVVVSLLPTLHLLETTVVGKYAVAQGN